MSQQSASSRNASWGQYTSGGPRRSFSRSAMSSFASMHGLPTRVGIARRIYKSYKRRGRSYRKGRRSYKKGRRSYKKGRRSYKKKKMTHGMMLGIKPFGELTPQFIRKYLKPGSWRFIETYLGADTETMRHNLSALVQRQSIWKSLNMIASLITRLPYIKFIMCSKDVQGEARRIYKSAIQVITDHKLKLTDYEDRTNYRLAKLAEMSNDQEKLEARVRQIRTDLLQPTAGGAGAAGRWNI